MSEGRQCDNTFTNSAPDSRISNAMRDEEIYIIGPMAMKPSDFYSGCIKQENSVYPRGEEESINGKKF